MKTIYSNDEYSNLGFSGMLIFEYKSEYKQDMFSLSVSKGSTNSWNDGVRIPMYSLTVEVLGRHLVELYVYEGCDQYKIINNEFVPSKSYQTIKIPVAKSKHTGQILLEHCLSKVNVIDFANKIYQIGLEDGTKALQNNLRKVLGI